MIMQIDDLLLGFIAASISVLTVHELIVLFLKLTNLLPESSPWSLKPTGPWNVPTVLNSVFWGGLWGVFYAIIHDTIDFAQVWEKGLLFGLFIAVISNFTVLPLIRKKPLFMDFKIKVIICVLVILSGFGISTAVLFDRLRS